MTCLEELDRKDWAGCIVDDDPEIHALPDGVTLEVRTGFQWPRHAVECFDRLLVLCQGKGGRA